MNKFLVCYLNDEAAISRLEEFPTMIEAVEFIQQWQASSKEKDKQSIDELFVVAATSVPVAQTMEITTNG